MARNDAILDLTYLIGKTDRAKKFYSTAIAKYNPKTVIYYNSDDDVLYIDEILFPGTADQQILRQTFYYSNVTNSGVDHTTIIMPWEVTVS